MGNKAKNSDSEVTVVARNRKARHELRIISTVEAGVMLSGTEVKALRARLASLDQAWADIDRGEAWLIDVNIGEYGAASWTNHAPRRRRKLLLHRKEIAELESGLAEGRTLVPLEIRFNERGFAKVLLGLGEGQQKHDRRENLRKRDAEEEIRRALARSRRDA